jgi:serine/threonine protein kinase
VGEWLLEQQIGAGSFAVVWKSRHVASGQLAAIKEINIDNLNKKLQESLASEISVLQHTKHGNVVQLLDIFRVSAPSLARRSARAMPSRVQPSETPVPGPGPAARCSSLSIFHAAGARRSAPERELRAPNPPPPAVRSNPPPAPRPQLCPRPPSTQEGNKIFLALEYCEGGDLAHYIRRNGRVSEATARYFLQHLAEGLKELRAHNVIHVGRCLAAPAPAAARRG